MKPVEIEPGKCYVIEHPGDISVERAAEFTKWAETHAPGVKFLVLARGARLVMRGEPAGEAGEPAGEAGEPAGEAGEP